jgi:hypothetical protein
LLIFDWSLLRVLGGAIEWGTTACCQLPPHCSAATLAGARFSSKGTGFSTGTDGARLFLTFVAIGNSSVAQNSAGLGDFRVLSGPFCAPGSLSRSVAASFILLAIQGSQFFRAKLSGCARSISPVLSYQCAAREVFPNQLPAPGVEKGCEVTDFPKEAESPVWTDDPFYWTFFVPAEYRQRWSELDVSQRAAIYATAEKASRHLRDSGVFDG